MQILANHAEMSRLASRVGAAATQAEEEVASCRGQLSSLQDSFQGATAAAFEERYEEWDTAAAQLTEALHGLGTWLQRASDTLAEHDESGAASLRA